MKTRYLLSIAVSLLAGLTGLTATEFHMAPTGNDAVPGTKSQVSSAKIIAAKSAQTKRA